MSYWETVTSPQHAGDVAGVYVLAVPGKALYVGQSLRLSERILSHKWRICPDGVRTKGGFVQGAYVKVRRARKFGDWLMIEARLIRKLNPERNIRQYRRAYMPLDIPEVVDLSMLNFDKQLTRVNAETPVNSEAGTL